MLNLKCFNPLGSSTRLSSPNRVTQSLMMPCNSQSEGNDESIGEAAPFNPTVEDHTTVFTEISSINPQLEDQNESIDEIDSTDPVFQCLINEIKSTTPPLRTSQSLSITNKSSSITTRSSLITNQIESDHTGWSSESGSINYISGYDDQHSAELATNDAITDANSISNQKMDKRVEVNHESNVKNNHTLFGRLICANRNLIRFRSKKRIDRETQKMKAKNNTANQILTMIKAQLIHPECLDQPTHDVISNTCATNQPANCVISDASVIEQPVDKEINHVSSSDEEDICSDLEDLFLRYLRLKTPDRSTALTFLKAFNPHFNHTLIIP